MSRPLARVAGILTALVATVGLAACGSDSSAAGSAPASVRVGYFPNVTHATGIVADKEGFFAKHLGATKLEVKTFNAGPAAMEALKSGAIDATYVGPGPATNAYINSGGQAVTVVAGAATGGTSFVVDPSIRTAADLKGKKVSTPQLGNTQDIALRYWLKQQGLSSDLQGGGDVSILPQENASILDAFSQKLIAGAWVPEPYATRMVQAGGKVLVDERDLWPGKKFAITVLAVRTDFLKAHPASVNALLAGDLDAARLHHEPRGEVPAGRRRRDRQGLRQAAQARGHRGRLEEPAVHRRPRARLDPRGRPSTPTPSASSRRSPSSTAGRPHPAQLPAQGTWKAGGHVVTATSTTLAAAGADASAGPALALDQVTKRYAGNAGVLALDGISLTVRPGEFVCLVGASGCGKSTLLNIVSGLDRPSSGTVAVDGHAALMFQESALFPWLSALDNVATPLRLKGVGRKEREAAGAGLPGRRAPVGLRRPAPARAVRRHAPARGDRPHPGHPGARPADGRAVRRARCDDPRPAARRAGVDLAPAGPDRALRDPQRPRGRAAR